MPAPDAARRELRGQVEAEADFVPTSQVIVLAEIFCELQPRTDAAGGETLQPRNVDAMETRPKLAFTWLERTR